MFPIVLITITEVWQFESSIIKHIYVFTFYAISLILFFELLSILYIFYLYIFVYLYINHLFVHDILSLTVQQGVQISTNLMSGAPLIISLITIKSYLTDTVYLTNAIWNK